MLRDAGFVDIEVTEKKKTRDQATFFTRAKYSPTQADGSTPATGPVDFMEIEVEGLPKPLVITKAPPRQNRAPRQVYYQESVVRYASAQAPRPASAPPATASAAASQQRGTTAPAP